MRNDFSDGAKRQAIEDSENVDCEEIRRLVKAAARRIVRRTAMSEGDLPDLEQTFRVALLEALSAFDARRGSWLIFAKRVLRHTSNNFLRKRFAAKCDPRRKISLHVMVKVDDDVYEELAEQVTYDGIDSRNGVRRRTERDATELRLDVEDFVTELPETLRKLARELMQRTPAEISRSNGTPYSTIQSRQWRLRQLAENKDLGKYLRR